MILAGPIAGVALERYGPQKADALERSGAWRARLLCSSSRLALAVWLLAASAVCWMFASPFFTSGRTAILPAITTPKELHTANSLTQTTKYMTVTLGTLFGGMSAAGFGFDTAFLINGASFFFSVWMVACLRPRADTSVLNARRSPSRMWPWHEYRDGLRYLRSKPLMFGIGLLSVGWATGGGAAQILFSMFGEVAQSRGLGHRHGLECCGRRPAHCWRNVRALAWTTHLPQRLLCGRLRLS
ncbi:MAG: MFS transporter [Bryobacterales bacterium]